MPRKLSTIAPDWWDYTTVDTALLEDAARLTPEDMAKLSQERADRELCLSRIRPELGRPGPRGPTITEQHTNDKNMRSLARWAGPR